MTKPGMSSWTEEDIRKLARSEIAKVLISAWADLAWVKQQATSTKSPAHQEPPEAPDGSGTEG